MKDEQDFSNKVIKLLDSSLGNMDQALLKQLEAGRERALSQYEIKQTEPRILAAGNAGSGEWSSFFNLPSRFLVPVALVVLMAMGIAYWQISQRVVSQQQIIETEEIDSGLLGDELPIDAYLDKGFDTWLRRSSS